MFYLVVFIIFFQIINKLIKCSFSAEPIRIESDFDAALARNLAVEILKSQQTKRQEQLKLKSASEKSRSRLNSGDSFGNSWRNNFKSTSSANSQKSIRKARTKKYKKNDLSISDFKCLTVRQIERNGPFFIKN